MSEKAFKGSKILLVEDEENLALGLKFNLGEEGYKVMWAKDGLVALEFFGRDEYELMILDIMLPHLNGFEVARHIRNASPQIPILMLTAKTSAGDRVQGLEVGADDYLTKPFHLQELLLRVKGMLKRKQWYKEIANEIYRFKDNEINFANLHCRIGSQEFQLTLMEAMVLRYLVEKRGKIVSRKELLENVWDISSDVETRTVDNFIVRLRKYLEPDPTNPVYIKSIRSAGYMFTDGG